MSLNDAGHELVPEGVHPPVPHPPDGRTGLVAGPLQRRPVLLQQRVPDLDVRRPHAVDQLAGGVDADL